MPHLYFNICIRVTIAENIVFSEVNNISISNSLESLADTAKVVLPRRFMQKGNEKSDISKTNLIDLINLGDKIKIEAGYDNVYNTEFVGYITGITDDIPIVLECMDEMYKLKKADRINKTFKSADLKDILKAIAPAYKIETFKECGLGKFIIENATPYEVLERLRTDCFVRTYFKDGVLYAGLPINLTGYKTHDFNMNKNVRSYSNLVYERTQKDYYLKVTSKEVGTSKPIYFEIGKKGDNNKEIKLNVGMTKADLKTFATDFYKGVVNTNCTGSFDSWGIPCTRAGDSANITYPNFPDKKKDGKFLISSVQIDLNGSDGFKRTNTISVKL